MIEQHDLEAAAHAELERLEADGVTGEHLEIARLIVYAKRGDTDAATELLRRFAERYGDSDDELLRRFVSGVRRKLARRNGRPGKHESLAPSPELRRFAERYGDADDELLRHFAEAARRITEGERAERALRLVAPNRRPPQPERDLQVQATYLRHCARLDPEGVKRHREQWLHKALKATAKEMGYPDPKSVKEALRRLLPPD